MSDKPWYISPSTFTNDAELCSICAHIDFAWLLENDFNKARYKRWTSRIAHDDEEHPTKIPWVSETAVYIFPDLSLGFLFEILDKRDQCAFCGLVSSTIAAAYGVEPELLLAQSFGDFPSHFVFCRLVNSRKDSTNVFAQIESYDLVVDLTNIQPNFRSFNQVVLHRIRDDIPSPFEGRSVGPRVNFKAVKEWLAHFQTSKSGNHEPLQGFRVIDVLNKNVIPTSGPIGCRYLTLSYVWGGPQEFQNVRAVEGRLRQPGSLADHQLPATIQDAIVFTAAVGEQYLWVDSLCIVQDDGDAKMTQINAMDQIYSYGLVTIISNDGTSCHSGLAGVRETKDRWKQHRANVRGLMLANKQAIVSTGKKRLWATRGWTFQEHALSRRCVQFSIDGVQFESEDGVAWEDTYLSPHDPSQPTPEPIGIPVAGSIQDFTLLSNIQLFSMAVTFYSFRSLSFQTDALNAFQGVLNVHQPRFRREFLYGMPSSELEIALLWYPGSRLERRVHEDTREELFPSWSWVGWQGMMTFPVLGPNHFSRVAWVDAIDNTIEFTSNDWRGANTAELGQWKIVPNRAVDCAPWYFEEENPNARFTHPVSKCIPDAIKERCFVAPHSHILKFHALTAQIKAMPGSRSLESPLNPNALPEEGVSSYTLQDRFDRFCGIVYLHSQNASFETKILECVAISRTSYGNENESLENPPSDDSDVVSIRDGYADRNELRKRSEERGASAYLNHYDFQLKWQAYDVLVLDRGNEGIAERVGVGFCVCEAFWDAGPRRERIALR